MIETAIGLGLFISLVFSETLGVAAGGMVVPGYLALMAHDPMRIAGTIAVSLVTLGCMKVVSRYALVYGRRRIVIAVLLGFVFGALSRDLLVFKLHGTTFEFQTIGYIIPGLIANWMERQGVIATISVMVTTAILVRLCLMLVGGGEIIR